MKKNSAAEYKKRFAVLALCALILLGALPGCAKKSGGDPLPTAVPTASPAASEEPTEGGALRLPMPVNAPCEDPFEVNTEEMLYLFSLVYESLISVNGSGELEPCLARSWSNEGGGVWLLHLREGVKWHDGSGQFLAHDVINSYRALCDMEDSYYKPCLNHIISMEAVDMHTVRVSFDITGVIALYSLTFPIKKSAPLVGTGCYRLESMSDDTVRLRVNEDWWDRRPYIDRIIFEERDNAATALASFEAGQLNLVPTDALTAGRYFESGVSNVCDVMTQSMETLLFNYSNPVLCNQRIRLAIAHGINRSKIITNVYSNRARAADVPIPPDSWLSDSRASVLNYDPDASRALIEEAGFTVMSKEGLLYSKAGQNLYVRLLTSATTDNTVRSEAAAMIASQLTELGFLVEVITKTHTLGDPESEFVAALRSGEWDIALVGFNLSLSNELTSYVSSAGANNFGGFSDPELAFRAFRMCEAENEESLREAAYELSTYFVETVPFVTLYFRLNSLIVSADIVGPERAREPYIFYFVKDWYVKKNG
jgi:peptide/nickel transport system substrate-binding protein